MLFEEEESTGSVTKPYEMGKPVRSFRQVIKQTKIKIEKALYFPTGIEIDGPSKVHLRDIKQTHESNVLKI